MFSPRRPACTPRSAPWAANLRRWAGPGPSHLPQSCGVQPSATYPGSRQGHGTEPPASKPTRSAERIDRRKRTASTLSSHPPAPALIGAQSAQIRRVVVAAGAGGFPFLESHARTSAKPASHRRYVGRRGSLASRAGDGARGRGQAAGRRTGRARPHHGRAGADPVDTCGPSGVGRAASANRSTVGWSDATV